MRPEREGLLNGDEPDYDSVESDYEPVLGAVPSANRRRSVPLSTRGRAINILQILLGEFFGVAMIIFVGCGVPASFSEKNPLTAALAFGGVILAAVQSFTPISGSHLNPVVTFCFVLSHKINILFALLYIVAQCLGATVGAALLRGIVSEAALTDYGVTKLDPSITPLNAVFLEVAMTFIFILVIYSTAVSSRAYKSFAPIPIALTVVSLILMGSKYTGASLNPARSFGPALVAGRWENHWIYWVGPIGGGLLGWSAYQLMHFKPK